LEHVRLRAIAWPNALNPAGVRPNQTTQEQTVTFMPLVHISLRKGKSRDYIRSIADGVHRALHEAFQVPPDDRFQLIHQFEPEDLIYDANYLGIQRSEDVVFVHIVAGKWRDTATKKAFYKRVVDLLAEKPGVRPEDVQIILSLNDREDWSFGKGLASYVKD
jgi:phenylpyruvate tautomerase PptA (4-oxalocrotonate tautomerase family)